MVLLLCAWAVVALCAVAVRKARSGEGPAVLPPPEPRAPRDLSRRYPRRGEAACARRLAACPVCGMTDPGNLRGDLLGWPAHRECAEWLGEWEPGPAGAVVRCSGVRVFRARDGGTAVRHWMRGVLRA